MRFRLRDLAFLLLNGIVSFVVFILVSQRCSVVRMRIFPTKNDSLQTTSDQTGPLQSRFSWNTADDQLRNILLNLAKIQWNKVLNKPDCPQRYVYPQTDPNNTSSYSSIVMDDDWSQLLAAISNCEVYSDDDLAERVLHQLRTLKIVNTEILAGGTQIKLLLHLENGRQAVLKPMRFDRDHEANPNHFYFSDFERHNAETAAFHLDKVLGYRRAIPTTGRRFNMTTELRATSDSVLNDTFFYSPAGNLCMVSMCKYYCVTGMAICGEPDGMEGSMQMFVDFPYTPFKRYISPYRRTYSKKRQKAKWQLDNSYCRTYILENATSPFREGRLLLDLVDMHILDFMMGNQDRHHVDWFDFVDVGQPSAVHVDNGRGFGRSDFDDLDIILPLVQCCLMRPSTAKTLLRYYFGKQSIGEALHESMKTDPTSPVLATKHLVAVNRRLEIVLLKLAECIRDRNGDYSTVLVNNLTPKSSK